MKHRCDAM